MTQKERRLAPGYCAGETTQQREIQTANILKGEDQILACYRQGVLIIRLMSATFARALESTVQ